MKPKWTGAVVGKMHVEEITQEEIAQEMGVGKPYVCMVLNGKRSPPNVQERIESAVDAILERRKEVGDENRNFAG